MMSRRNLKPEAPAGIRGELPPIATRPPGAQVGKLLPRIASVLDHLVVIRSIVGLRDEHSSFQNGLSSERYCPKKTCGTQEETVPGSATAN